MSESIVKKNKRKAISKQKSSYNHNSTKKTKLNPK